MTPFEFGRALLSPTVSAVSAVSAVLTMAEAKSDSVEVDIPRGNRADASASNPLDVRLDAKGDVLIAAVVKNGDSAAAKNLMQLCKELQGEDVSMKDITLSTESLKHVAGLAHRSGIRQLKRVWAKKSRSGSALINLVCFVSVSVVVAIYLGNGVHHLSMLSPAMQTAETLMPDWLGAFNLVDTQNLRNARSQAMEAWKLREELRSMYTEDLNLEMTDDEIRQATSKMLYKGELYGFQVQPVPPENVTLQVLWKATVAARCAAIIDNGHALPQNSSVTTSSIMFVIAQVLSVFLMDYSMKGIMSIYRQIAQVTGQLSSLVYAHVNQTVSLPSTTENHIISRCGMLFGVVGFFFGIVLMFEEDITAGILLMVFGIVTVQLSLRYMAANQNSDIVEGITYNDRIIAELVGLGDKKIGFFEKIIGTHIKTQKLLTKDTQTDLAKAVMEHKLAES